MDGRLPGRREATGRQNPAYSPTRLPPPSASPPRPQRPQRLQECFNTRQFDQAADLHLPGFFSHPLGATGFEAGKQAWHALTTLFPGIRVVAQDILVDGDKAAVRSAVEGIGAPDGGTQPVLFEIFRFDDGRFAEMWGASTGFPTSASPEDLLSQGDRP